MASTFYARFFFFNSQIVFRSQNKLIRRENVFIKKRTLCNYCYTRNESDETYYTEKCARTYTTDAAKE